MTMTRYTLNRFLSVVLAAAIAPAAFSQESLERWADQVWQSALQGNRAALDAHFTRVPGNGLVQEGTARFQQSLESYRSGAESAGIARNEARAEAFNKMTEQIEAGDLAQALRYAVEVQWLSDDYDAALTTPEIAGIIEWASREIPAIKESGDWLRAQELLFRMRTLFDDTSRNADYRKYDEQLEQVNGRVGLLARYAPRQLHELRNRNLERLGEAPATFNPGNVIDWRERVQGIDRRMVQGAIQTAASEHIESRGWRPLLEGGLESLRTLATTSMLEETFPSLGNQAMVSEWTRELNRELDALAKMTDRELDRWTCQRLLDRIEALNKRTLNLPDTVVYREFGDGAMQKLDQFSEVIWPDGLRRFRQATEGNFVGVGILIRNNEKREIVVVNPLDGTPAYFAGVKPEDIIAEVNGESTVGWSLNDAVDQITGPKGVPVTLGLRREGHDDLITITITRDTIKLQSVKGWWKDRLKENGDPEWDWFIDPHSRIAYVRLSSFNEDTYADLLSAWKEISADAKPNGLILDLRYNPGGLLNSAVQITNLFVRRGVIVSGENKDGARAWDQRAMPSGAELSGVPTVVLINKGSASGSEIVAGALQAYGAAVIVGERSFGKGSVQTVHQVATNAVVKLTTQYYRLPPKRGEEKGMLVHRRATSDVWGVDPDIRVPMTPGQIEESYKLRQQADMVFENAADNVDRPNINDLLTKGYDPQLQTALLILQARALGTMEATERHARSR